MIDLTEVLRLEVDVPGELDNLIRNPNGEKGAWFWKSAFSGHAVSSNGVRLRMQSSLSAAASSVVNSGFMQIPDGGGKYVAFRMTTLAMTASCQYRVTIFAYNAVQSVLGSTVGAWSPNTGQSNYTVAAWQLPAGTEYVTVQIMLDANPTTNNLPANAFVDFNQVKLAWASNSGGFLSTFATNYIENPSFEANNTNDFTVEGGLIANISQGVTARTGSRVLEVTKPVGSGIVTLRTDPYPVEPGKIYEASGYSRYVGSVGASFWSGIEFFDSDGALLSSGLSATVNLTNSGYQRRVYAATAPANAATAKAVYRYQSVGGQQAGMWLDDVMFTDNDGESWFYGSSPAAGQFQYGWEGAANASRSIMGWTEFGYTEPGNWFDLFNDGSALTVERASLDNGRLNAVVETEAFTQADILRAGRRIRWQTKVGEDWKSLYEGTISDWKTTHTRDTARTQIIAADELGQIQAYPWDGGIQYIEHIAYYLETYFNGLLPWVINGDYNHYSSTPTAVSKGVASNMLDHFRLCRDVERAYMFISREGVFIADNNNRVSGEQTFTDDSLEVWKTKLSTPNHGDGTAYTTSHLLFGVGNTRYTANFAYTLTGGAYRATVQGSTFNFLAGFYLRGQPSEAANGAGGQKLTLDYPEKHRFKGRYRSSKNAESFALRVQWYEGAATTFAPLALTVTQIAANTVANTWVDFEVIVDTENRPAGAEYFSVEIAQQVTGGWAVGDWVEVDDVQIDRMAGLLYYYDDDLEVAEDSQTVGNVLDIIYCDHNFTTQVTTQVKMGPYRDFPSISRYGQRKMEFIVQGINSVDVPTWANTTLSFTKDAEEVPSSLTIYITEPEETQLALLDLESLAEFVFKGTNHGYYAVSNIKHEVQTGNRWKITYDFVKSTALAKPVRPQGNR